MVWPTHENTTVAREDADKNLDYPANTSAQPNVLNISVTGNRDAWIVPSGALAPAVLTAYGFAESGTASMTTSRCHRAQGRD